MPCKLWDEITYPFLNFNDCTVEVYEWISNFVPHFIYVCNYLTMLGLKLNHVSKSGPRLVSSWSSQYRKYIITIGITVPFFTAVFSHREKRLLKHVLPRYELQWFRLRFGYHSQSTKQFLYREIFVYAWFSQYCHKTAHLIVEQKYSGQQYNTHRCQHSLCRQSPGSESGKSSLP